MLGKTPADQAFFRDMLANGIPVIDDVDMLVVYDAVYEAAAELDFYDVTFVENNLRFSNKSREHCVTIKKEKINGNTKLVFYTPNYNTAFENADIVGRVLLLVVTFCTAKQWLNISASIDRPVEESYEFDSDFV